MLFSNPNTVDLQIYISCIFDNFNLKITYFQFHVFMLTIKNVFLFTDISNAKDKAQGGKPKSGAGTAVKVCNMYIGAGEAKVSALFMIWDKMPLHSSNSSLFLYIIWNGNPILGSTSALLTTISTNGRNIFYIYSVGMGQRCNIYTYRIKK